MENLLLDLEKSFPLFVYEIHGVQAEFKGITLLDVFKKYDISRRFYTLYEEYFGKTTEDHLKQNQLAINFFNKTFIIDFNFNLITRVFL